MKLHVLLHFSERLIDRTCCLRAMAILSGSYNIDGSRVKLHSRRRKSVTAAVNLVVIITQLVIDYPCSRRTSIWWRLGAGRVSPLSTTATTASCDCRNSWKHTDPANFPLRSDSWAKARSIGELVPSALILSRHTASRDNKLVALSCGNIISCFQFTWKLR